MGKTLGYLLGGAMLLDGLMATIHPHYAFRFLRSNLRGYLPESLNRLTSEYLRMSDQSLRFLAWREIVVAGILLWLAAGKDQHR